MSKHSSIFSISIPTREQRTDADKRPFPQLGWWGGYGGEEGRGDRKESGLREESRRDARQGEEENLIK